MPTLRNRLTQVAGAPLRKLSGTFTAVGSLAAAVGAIVTQSVTITGAAIGDAVFIDPRQASNTCVAFATVTAADTVLVVYFNITSGAVTLAGSARYFLTKTA